MSVLKKIPLWLWIVAGMVLGVVWAFVIDAFDIEWFHRNWVSPWGELFIRLLKMLAVPIVVTSIITGIAGLRDLTELRRLGIFTVIYYLATTSIAIVIGIIVARGIKPGEFFSDRQRESFKEEYTGNIEEHLEASRRFEDASVLRLLVEQVPENMFFALTENRRMLQVIVFCILCGIALVAVGKPGVKQVIAFFEGLQSAFLWLISKVMYIAPIGVFALISDIVISTLNQGEGVVQLFQALLMYMGSVVLGLAILLLCLYPAIIFAFTGRSPLKVFRQIFPAQIVAFSTSSSAATLPVSLRIATRDMKVDSSVANFILPLGATVNMDGTALYQAVATIFIAQAMNIDLHLSSYLTILLTAVMASIGAAAVPGAGIIMLVVILESVGLSPRGISLILAVDRPLDMLRTVVNVTSDLTASFIINRYARG